MSNKTVDEVNREVGGQVPERWHQIHRKEVFRVRIEW